MEMASIASLMLAIVLVWSKHQYAWAIAFFVSLVLGLASSWIAPHSLVAIAALAAVVYYYHKASTATHRLISIILLTIVSIVYAIHAVPGFETIAYFENVFISDRKGTSSLTFTADKPIVGLFLLLTYRDRLCKTFADFGSAVKDVGIYIVFGTLAIYAIGYAIGFVRFDITIGLLLFPWLVRNLLFTVVAEEMLLRGVLQDRIETAIKHRNAPWIALLLASTLFGLVHIYGGIGLAVLATLAGVLYGYVYIKSRMIETAMLAHIVLNAGTASLFYYPGA